MWFDNQHLIANNVTQQKCVLRAKSVTLIFEKWHEKTRKELAIRVLYKKGQLNSFLVWLVAFSSQLSEKSINYYPVTKNQF